MLVIHKEIFHFFDLVRVMKRLYTPNQNISGVMCYCTQRHAMSSRAAMWGIFTVLEHPAVLYTMRAELHSNSRCDSKYFVS